MKSFSHYKNAVRIKVFNHIMKRKSLKTNRHIVVIESDDWGSVRMPSLEVRKYLIEQGITLSSPDYYDKYDSVASEEDLQALMDVLSSVKDANGNPAVITLNTCVANPDFKKIKDNDFERYYYEPFTETLKRYPNHDKSFDLWKQGISDKLFMPQFHGREHLNFQKWMEFLRNGEEDTRLCFENEVFSHEIIYKGKIESYLEAYLIKNESEYDNIYTSMKEGLDLFEQIFGFRSKSIIAPCYIWDDCIMNYVSNLGVKYIQGTYHQYTSEFEKTRGTSIIHHYLGETNNRDQIYLTRNAFFEPTHSEKLNADACLSQIDKLFKVGLPAIISSHRLNYIGNLVESNRDNTLNQLTTLLKTIVKKYPDVEFLSSDQIVDNM